MNVGLRDESLDGPAGNELLAAFATEIADLYPGWDPGAGPSADPEEFEAPWGRFVVAYRRGRAVECGGVKRLDSHGAEIKRLYVAREARGEGIARLILRRLEQVARESGHAVVRLDTGDRQPEALALFRSAGYLPTDDYNANPFASHWLEKRLARA